MKNYKVTVSLCGDQIYTKYGAAYRDIKKDYLKCLTAFKNCTVTLETGDPPAGVEWEAILQASTITPAADYIKTLED